MGAYIEKISALEILNSNSIPTLEVEIILSDGSKANIGVPSGTSKGFKEAYELIDESSKRFCGKGVSLAISNINSKINNALHGISPFNQRKIDQILIDLDGSQNKKNLGSNAILGVSLAVAKVAARSLKIEFFQYIGGFCNTQLPIPMINIINGGAHGNNNLQIQEFMLVPQKKFPEEKISTLIEKSTNVYMQLQKILQEKGMSTNVGMEGGFAPNLHKTNEALDLLCLAVINAGYKLEEDFKFSLDCAANEFYENGLYIIDGQKLTALELISFYENILEKYPIFSIEDPLYENDLDHWRIINDRIGDRVKIIGDDLFATNINYLQNYYHKKVANSILIKANQIGTLTETIDVINYAKDIGYDSIISHRSGETNDDFLIHIALATRSKFVKIGAPNRGERVAKFNALLRIEKYLSEI